MLRPKLIPAIAVAALVFAVFGSTTLGEAARQLVLPKGSVGAAQLKANAVTGTKVKDGCAHRRGLRRRPAPRRPAGAERRQGRPGTPEAMPARRASQARGARRDRLGRQAPAGSAATRS